MELLSAQRNEGGTASEAFLQQLAAFRVDVDEAMLHMLSKRLEVALYHQEVSRPEGNTHQQCLTQKWYICFSC